MTLQAVRLAHLRAMLAEHQMRAETSTDPEARRAHRSFAEYYERDALNLASRIEEGRR